MKPRAETKRTEDQSAPAKPPAHSEGREALLAVFPAERALAVPLATEAFGRSWLAERLVDDPKISGNHFRVVRSNARLHLEDLSSRNGTWVNGLRVPAGERVLIDDGAVIRAGNTVLVYRRHFSGDDG